MSNANSRKSIVSRGVAAAGALMALLILSSCGQTAAVPKDKPSNPIQQQANVAATSKEKAEGAASATDKHFEELNSKMEELEE